ncbi:MAG: AI-2E family transporter [Bacteroidaceae bacterium]|nr:AI-2E family transporter [Bacteroidaceae bacterium]
MKYQEVTLGRFLRIILVLITIGISYLVLNSLSSVLLPFAVAWLVAYLLYPMVCFVQYKLRFKSRLLAILAVMLVVVSLIVGFAMLIAPSITNEFNTFKNVTVNFLSNQISNPSISPVIIEAVREYANEQDVVSLLQNNGVQDLLQNIYQHTQSLLVGTIGVIVHLFSACIALLYIFFILLDYEKLSDEWKLFLPVRWREIAAKLSSDISAGMNQYFRGQALVALCVGILYSTGFLIIDFPLAIGFGLFIGLLNLVPYLQLVSLLPMIMLSLLKAANNGENFWFVLLSAFIVLAIVQVIQDLILVPCILGRGMKLHPAIILLSLAIWGKLLGVLGMIVALPMTTLLIGYIKRYHEINSIKRCDVDDKKEANETENALKKAISENKNQ